MSKNVIRYYWTTSPDQDGKHTAYCVFNMEGEMLHAIPTEEKLADYSFVQSQFRSMLGRVLTIIDASITDPRQLKAIKDLIRNQFIDEYVSLQDMMTDKKVVKDILAYANDEKNFVDFKPEEVSIEDVAGH